MFQNGTALINSNHRRETCCLLGGFAFDPLLRLYEELFLAKFIFLFLVFEIGDDSRPYDVVASGSECGDDLFGRVAALKTGVVGSIKRLGSFLKVSKEERDSSSSVLINSS